MLHISALKPSFLLHLQTLKSNYRERLRCEADLLEKMSGPHKHL